MQLQELHMLIKKLKLTCSTELETKILFINKLICKWLNKKYL